MSDAWWTEVDKDIDNALMHFDLAVQDAARRIVARFRQAVAEFKAKVAVAWTWRN